MLLILNKSVYNNMEQKAKIPPELQVNQSSLHHRFAIFEDQKLLISKYQHKQYYQERYSNSSGGDGGKTRNNFLSTPDLILKSQLQMAEQEAEEEKEIEQRRRRKQRQQYR